MTAQPPRTAAQALVAALRAQGCDLAFTVPGESFLAVLDALFEVRDRFRLITCRHESGAANAAEAAGKLTGRPGIAFVTRGPGALNAAIGVHTAFQDSTPMLLFVGQVARGQKHREAFQEFDTGTVFGGLAKWAADITEPERVPEFIARAVHVAVSGRPGPVVLGLPEDMLDEPCPAGEELGPSRASVPSPAPGDMARLAGLLGAARRPLVLVGGPGWDAASVAALARFLQRFDLPAMTSFRAKDRIDNTLPHYVGDCGIGIDPKLGARIAEADLLLAIGPRLGEMTTAGYTRLAVPKPRQRLVHVHPGAEELNRVYQAELAILSGVAPFAAALEMLVPPEPAPWADWRAAARADYEAFIRPVPAPGAVNPSEIVRALSVQLPADAILCNGAGNYAGWLHRFHLHRRFPTQLGPTSGAMGYGVPAALAAKLIHPERLVVAAAGDGCFLMTGQELATAVQYQLAILILVFNNGMYGTIRMHQERHYPGRVSGTDLQNPNFAALARAYGAFGARVDATAEFPAVLAEALAFKGPALIEIAVDPEAISPTATLSGLRAAGGRP